ncbi:hypothetical protein SAMN05192534_101398 [Alteribacillus persepolensis]|uniref:Cytochrome C and Quinol oxidase polypeptide I n=1 Tax=Alteribacillus persepolensis TaxID=568899 RepID=A0A1G7Z4C6_9BACI|nr:cbb3-type cytochrome c oxidase subunit I [Alteribacillus persepolensis]SDH03568.1 hypothetical protein SAMN05192534_101398 [Alteribacillus persepolensis]
MTARFMKIAVVYLFIGVCMGLYMGISQQFTFTTVHAHLHLLGWVSMALFGVIYYIYPTASRTRLATIHFWLHNIGVPLMQGTLFIMLWSESYALVSFTITGSVLIVLGALLFMINVFRHANRERSAAS